MLAKTVLFFIHFLISGPLYSASSTSLISSNGEKIQFSSVTVSVELFEYSTPKLLSTGHYSEYVIEKVTAIFKKTLKTFSSELFLLSPFSHSLFNMAHEEVMTKMNVNYMILLPDVITRLTDHYVSIARRYNSKSSNYPTGSLLHTKRTEISKEVVVFIQECIANGGHLGNSDKLIFLEFIYRFLGQHSNGDRYGTVMQSLYCSLDPDTFNQIYNILVDFFNPDFSALPVFFIKTEVSPCYNPIKIAFIDFLSRLHEKINVLDPVADKDRYTRHAAMLFTSTLSCSFYDIFMPLLLEIIQRIDILHLACSSRFIRAVSSYFELTKDTTDQLSELIVSRFISDQVFMNIVPDQYIQVATILNIILLNNFVSNQDIHAILSTESCKTLTKMMETLESYTLSTDVLKIFDELEENFGSMPADDLTHNTKLIAELIPRFPDYFTHSYLECGTMLGTIVKIIPKLVRIAISEPNPELDIRRFLFLIQIMKLSFAGKYVLQITSDSLAKLLVLYNIRIAKNQSSELDGINDVIFDLLKAAVDNNVFFQSIKLRATLWNYFRLISSSNLDAENRMNAILLYKLKHSSNMAYSFTEYYSTCKRLSIDCVPALILFLVEEANRYIKDHSASVTLDLYLDGKILLLIKIAVESSMISKTESIMFQSFINKYSSSEIVTSLN